MNRIFATHARRTRGRSIGLLRTGWAAVDWLRSCPRAKAGRGSGARPRKAATRETWDVYLLQGQRVGYGRTTVRREIEAGRAVVRTENTSHLSVKRGGQTSEQDIRGVSVETPEGRLLRFESEIRMGPGPIRVTGEVHGDRLDMKMLGAGGDDAEARLRSTGRPTAAGRWQSSRAWPASRCSPASAAR